MIFTFLQWIFKNYRENIIIRDFEVEYDSRYTYTATAPSRFFKKLYRSRLTIWRTSIIFFMSDSVCLLVSSKLVRVCNTHTRTLRHAHTRGACTCRSVATQHTPLLIKLALIPALCLCKTKTTRVSDGTSQWVCNQILSVNR